MKRAPNCSYWYTWKLDTLAYAPRCSLSDIGDIDGEWEAVGGGFFWLVVDLRGVGYL
jgi:hypothetical protein